MPVKAGQIVIDISAGTAKMILDLEQAKGKVREFGSATTASMAKSSAAIRELEGNFANNTRALSRFAVETLRLGPLLNAAFPVVGALAFGGAVLFVGKKVADFFQGIRDAPRKIGDAFRELNAPLRVVNDELRVTRDKLTNSIAELQGKRQNNLALDLDEARLNADKLAESLGNDLKKLDELMKKQAISSLSGAFTDRASTSEDENANKEFLASVGDILDRGTQKVQAATNKKDAATAQREMNAEILGALDAQIAKTRVLISESQKLQATRKDGLAAVHGSTFSGDPTMSQRAQAIPADQSGLLKERSGYLQNLQLSRDKYALSGEVSDLEGKKNDLELLKKIREEMVRLTNELAAANAARLDGIAKINAEEQVELGRMRQANVLTGETRRLTALVFDAKRIAYGQHAWEEFGKALQEQRAHWLELSMEARKAEDGMFSKDIEKGKEIMDQTAKSVAKAVIEYGRLNNEIRTLTDAHNGKMFQLQNSSADPLKVLGVQQDAQRSEIQQRYNRDIAIAVTDLQKANVQRQRALDLDRLDYEMQERIAEERQKGLRDFFLEMERQSETAGHILYDALHNALDGVSDQLAKLMTGQKTSFGKMLQSQGEGILKSSIKSLAQTGLGKLGAAFGVSVKADGSKANPFYVVNVDGAGGAANPASMLSGLAGLAGKAGGFIKGLFGGGGASAAGGAAGSGGSGLSGFLDSFGGMMAEGGSVDPGHSYGVGDNGLEIFTPRTSGTITPLDKMGMGGTTFHIDARGAALGSEERIARAVTEAHNSAISQSVRANQERFKRTPQRAV